MTILEIATVCIALALAVTLIGVLWMIKYKNKGPRDH